MLIVEVKQNEGIDKSLKILKNKVIKTKQFQELYSRKNYIKKSVLKRSQKLKAIYTQKIKNLK
jgi:small subunit ribosomal protein S21